ncbi:TonB-dependent receptor plug domain-containing protein [Vibrio penaeicida]|uniref:TonB-dependent receptor plug domain-containing protein n=1 Tax=Vibrio penaeicida TaxID=104609 RepID=A0AAV5NKR6_9VIBR|nr:TonB-dependent receptor plug domain-containing protein [Vibrio penaeicida]RTZ22057.1 hypothetical protein EKN09_16105 [Vibrio penaeicida]GLQ71245.1 hypothetical protein GCM10007932_06050 [Vibrio penaeicida]
MKALSTRLLPYISVAIVSGYATANTKTPEIMVVTGTKTERALLDTPVRTEVITEVDLERNHARSLEEALRFVPGVQLVDRHGKGGKEVILQGVDGQRVLVLVDGLPTSPTSGTATDVSKIAVAGVKQIEIVKGAVSALYGSNAMGGVINIITKRPFNKSNEFKLTLDAGTYGEHNVRDFPINDGHANLYALYSEDNWYLQFVGDSRNMGGVDLDKGTFNFEDYAGSRSNISLTAGLRTSDTGLVEIKPTLYQEDIYRHYETFSPGVGEKQMSKVEKSTRYDLSVRYEDQFADDVLLSAYYMLM